MKRKPKMSRLSKATREIIVGIGKVKDVSKTLKAFDELQMKPETQKMFLNSMKNLKKGKVGYKFDPKEFKSNFYKNCRVNRKRRAKICDSCPFRAGIEAQEYLAILPGKRLDCIGIPLTSEKGKIDVS